MTMKLNPYCNECLTRTKQHCEGRDDAADDAATNQVCVWSDDGESYEIKQDYIQTGAGSGGSNKPHGLKFCPEYQLDPAMLPRAKSAKAIRDEFNAQRAANKAVTKAKKDAARAEKQAEKKLKAKARYDKKQAAQDKKQESKAAKRETPVVVQTMDDDEFSDLII